MWTLGIATAAIGAVIALLLVLYLRLSAREDMPPPLVARPPLRLRPARLRGAPERLRHLRPDPSGETPECETAAMLLFPNAPAVAAAASTEGEADHEVPMLEAVLIDSSDQERALAAAVNSTPAVSSARLI